MTELEKLEAEIEKLVRFYLEEPQRAMIKELVDLCYQFSLHPERYPPR